MARPPNRAVWSLFWLLASAAAPAVEGQSAPRPAKNSTAEQAPAAAPAQPLHFSHKAHVAALKLKCAECHANSGTGEQMSYPAAAQCMFCHVAIAKDRPDIQKLARFAKDKEEIPWARVYSVPDWVFWSHRTHLEAKVECEACHGRVAEMEATARATEVTTMGGCVGCHQKGGAGPTGCLACHEGKH